MEAKERGSRLLGWQSGRQRDVHDRAGSGLGYAIARTTLELPARDNIHLSTNEKEEGKRRKTQERERGWERAEQSCVRLIEYCNRRRVENRDARAMSVLVEYTNEMDQSKRRRGEKQRQGTS